MKNIFQTFKPKHALVKRYIDYYYLDIKENNTVTEYECFPHYNNTISLYKSNIYTNKEAIVFNENAAPLQIFVPVREKTLNVKQIGKVHRIVIVFRPFGINQFYRDIHFSNWITNYEFFSQKEMDNLFATQDISELIDLLDNFLYLRLKEISNPIVEKSLDAIFGEPHHFHVEKLSQTINISRKHINRVFKQNIGVSIKRFHQIILFRKTIEQKLSKNTTENFTQIASEFQYSDQSHLNKVYKNFTDNTPRDFFNKGSMIGKEDLFWHFKK
ncbi:helix-turn-helix domain-containing protein [Chryseobacterium sp. FH1]|uniref:helix-turn-helix domain-containing protein n=1 Tax=Chryseobacterium sp. FH1 TaxID=1233951 RepID=UPI0004E2A567|nr:helix-turn-helix domain-containing protein [Chryseobacterium sp. FH1]KFC22872.1 hypothetical protein IO90_04735 [Chryseobacterium sp. FH1]